MAKVDTATVKQSADILRDLKNWVAVFDNEDELSAEAKETLNQKIEEVAEDLADVHCIIRNGAKEVDDEALDSATDAMREFKNWVEVFKTENEVSGEAEDQLDELIEKLARSIANIRCK